MPKVEIKHSDPRTACLEQRQHRRGRGWGSQGQRTSKQAYAGGGLFAECFRIGNLIPRTGFQVESHLSLRLDFSEGKTSRVFGRALKEGRREVVGTHGLLEQGSAVVLAHTRSHQAIPPDRAEKGLDGGRKVQRRPTGSVMARDPINHQFAVRKNEGRFTNCVCMTLWHKSHCDESARCCKDDKKRPGRSRVFGIAIQWPITQQSEHQVQQPWFFRDRVRTRCARGESHLSCQ